MTLNVKNKKRMSGEEKIYHAVVIPIFILLVLLCAYPFYYLMICTVSANKFVDAGKVVLFPKGFHLDNYVEMFQVDKLLWSIGVSVARVIVGTGIQILFSSYAAYFFTKEDIWLRKLWYRMIVATMYFSAGMIPVYLNWRMLGLQNTFWIYIVPTMLQVYNMVLIKTSMEALPRDLEESAFLDGAGYMTRFIRIVLPLQKPILATVGLFGAVGHWNDFFTTKMYVTNTKLYTVQFKLYELLNQITAVTEDQMNRLDVDAITPMSARMTLTAIVVIPIMLVYPFIQKFYVKGIMVGAIKG